MPPPAASPAADNANPPPLTAAAAASAAEGTMRPPLMRKQSSQSSHTSSKQVAPSPSASVTDSAQQHPLRHAAPGRRKVVLPRNHSSARNLAAHHQHHHHRPLADDGRRHARQRSHEGDTEIRLPGSLDESVASSVLAAAVTKPPMRRNMTAYQLPRNSSHAKLKKNLSHGQLTRLGSGKNLAALGQKERAAPLSPGLKGRSKRPKSAEMSGAGEGEEEARRPAPHQRKNSAKKVGFAVGSAGDTSEGEEGLQMEGSGLQEDEWTEDSASASPYSTRVNTANNSRTSVVVERLNEKLAAGRLQEYKAREERESQKVSQEEEEEDESDEDSDDAPSPLTMGQGSKALEPNASRAEQVEAVESHTKQASPAPATEQPTQQAVLPKQTPPQRSSLHLAKKYTNPTTQRLLDKNQQLPAPALVSNVSALDDTHSSRGSPAPSRRSSRSNILDGNNSEPQEDELVSRFVPSGSHPSTGSGPTTALSTPKTTGFHTPEEDSTLSHQRREPKSHHNNNTSIASSFQVGPVSPTSTVSGSSGATTPAIGRSRTELRMLQEKAIADIESQADARPHLPKHIFDRRNESLKYYLNANNERAAVSTMGPDVFQGRFRALNTELRVVQKFRDPIGEAVTRLKNRSGQGQRQTPLAMSKSAVSLPVARRIAADLSKSASPPRAASLRGGAGSSAGPMGRPRREVSFARSPPQTREFEVEVSSSASSLAPDVIAKRLWEAV